MIRMMVKSLLGSVLFSVALLSTPAFAQLPVTRIESITASGTGCPAGSIQALNTSNGSSVLFGSYQVINASGVKLLTRGCTLTVTLLLPPGRTVVTSSLLWRGSEVPVDTRSFGTFARSLSYNGGFPVVRSTTTKTNTGFTSVDDLTGKSTFGCQGGRVRLCFRTLLGQSGAVPPSCSRWTSC